MAEDNTQVVPLAPAAAPSRPLRASTEAVQKRKLALAKGAHEAYVKKTLGNTTPEKSNQPEEDPLNSWMSSGKVIEPPFDLLGLSMLSEQSSELLQNLQAMEVGVEGWGHRLVPRLKFDDQTVVIPEEVKKAANAERVRLMNFFEYASIDDDFTSLRRKLRRDKESIGAMCFEIIRNAAGEIQGMEHMPASQVRLGRQSEAQIEVEVPIVELQEDGSIEIRKVTRWKRHRLFLQTRQLRRSDMTTVKGNRHVWFKEFLDPRAIDNKTGEEVPPEKVADLRAQGRLANEMLYLRYYTPRTSYGLPNFIGNLLSIYGDRAAEEINFITFKNNNVPSMAVLVSNGQLTEATVKRIESFVESQIQGSDNYSKFLIIEAESFIEGEDGGHMKVDIKPLTKSQHQDAMFQEYSANNRDAIRRSFRLPPILVGRSDDYTRSTAETSRKLADEQVFGPERDIWDNWVNRRLFPAMGIRYWKYKSNSPNTTDNTELVKILSGAEKTGGMTPRIARVLLEDVLNQELPDFPEDFNPDLPFSLTMAEAVKNEADPTEPGQQTTALKHLAVIKSLTEGVEDFGDDIDEKAAAAVQSILKIRNDLEDKWSKMTKDEGWDAAADA